MTDLEHVVAAAPLTDTHEHLQKEPGYVEEGPDLLRALFDNYVLSDLAVAGARPDALRRLTDARDLDWVGRFRGIEAAWEHCQFTGYGEAVRWMAEVLYEIPDGQITPAALAAAQTRHETLRRPGERLRLLREVAGLHHVQIDDFRWSREPDAGAPEFFLYDLNWMGMCNGDVSAAALHEATGVDVKDTPSLAAAIETLFARQAPVSVAVKAQHAYVRTLRWAERADADADAVLQKQLRGEALTEGERLCLGDWCWERGVQEATAHHLPFKIHTGHYAGSGNMPMERIRASHLCPLLTKYPQTRFVLMHISYPYSDELVSLAKHYPNAWVDLCWAWSIDPHAARDFVRRMLHAVPVNKLFGFGGDAFWPTASVAYAWQARRGIVAALKDEVADGFLSERQAVAVAERWMGKNQDECFDIAGTQAAMRAAAK